MNIFNKLGSNSEAASAGIKRDVTIVIEPKKRPDHVRAETSDCTWKIPLTLEEQFDLGQVYEGANFDDETSMLERFTETVYQNTAATLNIEIRPSNPGHVFMKANAGHHFRDSRAAVSYDDVAQTVYKWIVQSQPRRDLISDLVSALPEIAEQR